LDPEYLRRIQDYVPAHLLDDPPPRETLVAAGNLDIEDVMMMEALYLSLRDGEEEDERRRREEAEAAAEAAEVEAAIAAVAAAEAAEANRFPENRGENRGGIATSRRADDADDHDRADDADDHDHDHEDDNDRSFSTAMLNAEAERVTRLRTATGIGGGSPLEIPHLENLAESRCVAAATKREDGDEERHDGDSGREGERERGSIADAADGEGSSAGGEGSSSKARDAGAPEDGPEEDGPEDHSPEDRPARSSTKTSTKTSAAEALARAAAETEAVAMQMEALRARGDELERAEASVEALLERLVDGESREISRGARDSPDLANDADVPETDVRGRTQTAHSLSRHEDEEVVGEAREASRPSANEPEPEPKGVTETESSGRGADARASDSKTARVGA